jgi:hypothetical protein
MEKDEDIEDDEENEDTEDLRFSATLENISTLLSKS